MLEILIAANVAITVIGGGVLVRWLVRHIHALEGTVDAQGKTLATVEKLNETVLKVFQAMDPERWAKEVKIHKELADTKVEALLEQERRKLQEEKAASEGRIREVVGHLDNMYRAAILAAFDLIPYVPMRLRVQVIRDTKLSEGEKKTFLDLAEKAPDWSGSLGLGIVSIAEMLGTNPKTGGMNVRPPVDD